MQIFRKSNSMDNGLSQKQTNSTGQNVNFETKSILKPIEINIAPRRPIISIKKLEPPANQIQQHGVKQMEDQFDKGNKYCHSCLLSNAKTSHQVETDSEVSLLSQFMLARFNFQSGIFDLSYCSLSELVQLLHSEQVINQATFCYFKITYNQKNEEDWKPSLALTSREQIFTLFDHRLLAMLLLARNTQKYTCSRTSPILFSKQATQYLKGIYQMCYHQYSRIYCYYNSKCERFWMPRSIFPFDEGLKLDFCEVQDHQIWLKSYHGRLLRSSK